MENEWIVNIATININVNNEEFYSKFKHLDNFSN